MASFELPMESSDSDSVPPCLCENKGISYKSQRCMEASPLELYFFSLCCLRYLLVHFFVTAGCAVFIRCSNRGLLVAQLEELLKRNRITQ
jgi:hypothetical protein